MDSPGTFTWRTQEVCALKICYIYPKKPFFKLKNFSHPPERTNSPLKEKNFLYLPEKITNFSSKAKISCN